MAVTLTARDESRLKGLHPDLVRVVRRAAKASGLGFVILEGLRTIERQRELLKAGATKTLNSRHIKAANGLGHAVDIAPTLKGKVTWEWPLYHKLAAHIKAAAKAEKVTLEWGGDWKTFKDGPHWQLPWLQYPASAAPPKPKKAA